MFAIAAILLLSFGCVSQEEILIDENEYRDAPEANENEQNVQEVEEDQKEVVGDQKESENGYTMSEVAAHNAPEDCWLVIDGKIYDATPAIKAHVGGEEAIIRNCGKDATIGFTTRPRGPGTDHPQKAYEFLPNLYIGELN